MWFQVRSSQGGSSFTRSQIAALFMTMLGTMIPVMQFSGMLSPVSSLAGPAAVIGNLYPASHYLTISCGVFNKGLDFVSLQASFWPLIIAVPIILFENRSRKMGERRPSDFVEGKVLVPLNLLTILRLICN